MNIQENKQATIFRKRQADNSGGMYQAAAGQLLYGVARDAMGQAQQIMANDQNREKAAQEAANIAATQAANKTGLEAQQARDQEQQERQHARAQQSQSKVTVPNLAQPKNHFVRNALIIGGTSTAAIVGGSTLFPIFHTSILS